MYETGKHSRGRTMADLHARWAAGREAARQALIRQIEEAFQGVELGRGTSLHQARAHDNYESDEVVAEVRSLDTERHWQDVTDEKLDRLSGTLAFMDDEGFRFYLPRFMVYALHHPESDSGADAEAARWCDPREATIHGSLMSPAQWDAIRAFAAYAAES